MDKRITASVWYGSVGCLIGLLSFYRWGLFSLLGFYPANMCSPKVANRFFDTGGNINQRIVNKIDQDYDLLNCTFQNAVKHQSLSSLQPLIDNGIEVNTRDKKGMTALFFARNEKIIKVLIDNGANVNARAKFGRTPLSTVKSSLEYSQEQLKLYSSLPDQKSYKTEQITYQKESIIAKKEIMELLESQGGID